MLQALRIRDFRLLWGAGLFSSLGSWLLVLAVPAHVFLVTGSLAGTGLTLAAEYLPVLVLGPVAGVAADRWDRRRLMLACDVFRAGAVAVMLAGVGPGRFWVFYVALAAESGGSVLFRPALLARTPAVVGTGCDLSSANALNAVSAGVVRIAGGPLGGVLLAVSGIRTLICADVVSYLVSAAAMAMTSRQAGGGGGPRTTLRNVRRDLADGLRVLRGNRVAGALLPVTVIFLAANASLSAVLVPFGLQRLGGSVGTGILLSALGAGFLLGGPLLRMLADRFPPRNLLTVSLVATAVGYFLLFRSPSLAAAVPCAVAIGTFGSTSLVVPQTAVQRAVHGAVLGRVSAIFLTGEAAATLIGAVIGPVLAQAVQLPGLAAVASLTTVTGAVLTYVCLPPAGRAGLPGDGDLRRYGVPSPGVATQEELAAVRRGAGLQAGGEGGRA